MGMELISVYVANKDSDERPLFFVDVSPKGSDEPKFKYAGDVTRMAGDMKAIGDANREKVLHALSELTGWRSPKEMKLKTGMSESTVNKHLKVLFETGKAERRGNSRNIQYRATFDHGENTPRGNTENLFENND